VAGAEVAEMLGTEGVALELDEVSAGLRTRTRALLVTAAGRGEGGKERRLLEDDPDLAAAAIVDALRKVDFTAFLVGETRFGAVVAARTAARLRVCSLGKGKRLRVEEGRLVVERDVYGGKFLATVGAKKMPCVAMVQAGAYKKDVGADSPSSVETIEVSVGPPDVHVVEVRSAGRQAEDAGIKSASIVVAAGRGFAKKDDLVLAKDLADALGAALGCSRPLSSDLGWMDEDAHIGLTGAYVHPKLYIAVGISGQLQHVAGIKGSKVIVAINKDRQAPIFQVADYGVVGDLYDVLPAITRLLKGTQ
jgi:electron transfer flavoprotein alpha subunit